MATKQKRAAGGGRKPKGDFSQVVSPLSIRMRADMREQLEAAANANGRSISQELLGRLQGSFRDDRDKARDPAIRALCFLIAQLAGEVSGLTDTKGRPLFDWRTDRFFYKAFKLAVSQVLDALEPSGEIRPPQLIADAVFEGQEGLINAIKASYETPEVRADMAAKILLSQLQRADPHSDSIRQLPQNHRAKVESAAFGYEDARDDLRIKPPGGKS
jgi:hypothetical protein